MSESGPIHMSEEGFEKLKAELHKLKYVDRPTIVAEIKRAREMGDLSENAEYHAAKEAQTHIERAVAETEFKLSRALVVKKEDVVKGKAYLFAKITLIDLDDDEEEVYTLVSAEETDPDQNHISVTSPIGKGLLGKEVGDEVEIQVPAGVLKYKITKIE
ncbi:MAG: transcription elongation factor GreA [FCB group bacterium]|nr:transcription elongation factor GreA [FCB group bacterium]